MSGRLTLCGTKNCALAATCWRASTTREPRDHVVEIRPLQYSDGETFCGFYEPQAATGPRAGAMKQVFAFAADAVVRRGSSVLWKGVC